VGSEPGTSISTLTRETRGLLVGVVLVAAVLRFWGIDFGLPYFYHPDEPAVIQAAQHVFKTGDPNPRYSAYPGIVFYLNALAYVPYYVAGRAAGVFHNPANIPAPVMLAMGVGRTTMPTSVLLGRSLTAVFGVCAVVLAFLCGWKLRRKPTVGLMAAFAMAISPTNVSNSRFVTPDTFLVFFLMLASLGTISVYLQGRPRDYALAGVACGLVASSKYNGGIILLPVVLAHFLRRGFKGWKDANLYLAISLSAAAFVLTNPVVVLAYRDFRDGLLFQARGYGKSQAGMKGSTVMWYLTYSWQHEGPVALLAIAEILRGMRVRCKGTLLLSVFPVVYFAFICTFPVRNNRTLLPVTPFLFLLGASLLMAVTREIAGRQACRTSTYLMVGLLSLVTAVWPLQQTIKGTLELTALDGREMARVWIEQNLPPGARIALEAYAPFVDPQRFSVQGLDKLADHPADWYAASGFDYLVFSQCMFGRFYYDQQRYAAVVSQYEDLFHAFELVRTFPEGTCEIRIYRVTKQGR